MYIPGTWFTHSFRIEQSESERLIRHLFALFPVFCRDASGSATSYSSCLLRCGRYPGIPPALWNLRGRTRAAHRFLGVIDSSPLACRGAEKESDIRPIGRDSPANSRTRALFLSFCVNGFIMLVKGRSCDKRNAGIKRGWPHHINPGYQCPRRPGDQLNPAKG